MNKYVKTFLQRGLTFGGFGPIVAGIVYVCLQNSIPDFSLTGGEVCIAIISTYILAFLQSGAGVFNQIEHWGIAKSMLCNFSTVYVAYVLCYVLNSWIPFEPMAILIFTAIFVVSYFVICISVYIGIKATSKKLNAKLS